MHGLSASFVASGLRAGTQYRFMVAAKNLVGRGAWSAPATATTRAVAATTRAVAAASASASATAFGLTMASGRPSRRGRR